MTISLLSWNVNGIRAAERKGFVDFMGKHPADIVCLQETKAHPDQLSMFLRNIEGYTAVWNSAEKKGYSGTATYSTLPVLSQNVVFVPELLNGEGRIVMTEHERFYLFNVYFPNGAKGPEHFKYKFDFYRALLMYTEKLRKEKPVVICGDMNIAHCEIDLARPKENAKSVGFTPAERALMDEMAGLGYVDTFRELHPEEVAYSWWDMKTASRERDVGWRLDAFWVSSELMPAVKEATILKEVMGSDHCPAGLTLVF